MSSFDLPPLGGPSLANTFPVTARGDGVAAAGTGAPAPGGFGNVLADAIEHVDGLSRQVGEEVKALASGEPIALHDIMLSMGKSEVAFNLMLEVRNKLVDAWEKLSRSVV